MSAALAYPTRDPSDRSLRLVVFDFDGTLVDSQHGIAAAMAEAFAAHGLAPPQAEAVRGVIGLTLESAVARLLPDPRDLAGARRIADAYREAFHLRRHGGPEESLFPGAREAIASLDRSGILLGIATGKGRRGLTAALDRLGLAEAFVTLQTVDDAPGKPHPEMLRRAMAEAGAEPWETAVIGDTTYDMEMAANAKVAAFGVAWGYHAPAALTEAGAAAIVECFELLETSLRDHWTKGP